MTPPDGATTHETNPGSPQSKKLAEGELRAIGVNAMLGRSSKCSSKCSPKCSLKCSPRGSSGKLPERTAPNGRPRQALCCRHSSQLGVTSMSQSAHHGARRRAHHGAQRHASVPRQCPGS